MTRPTPAPAAQAAAGDVWRAVDGDGTVHDVAVERVPPPEWAGWWRVVGTRGTSLASMSPRASVVLWAMDRMGIAEILSPGEPSRAELTADLARLRAPADLAAIEARAPTTDAERRAHFADGCAVVVTECGGGLPEVVVDVHRADDLRDAQASSGHIYEWVWLDGNGRALPDVAHIAAERERHAAELASYGDALGRSRESIAEACDAAVAEERARCAAVCRAVARGWPGDDVAAARMALSEAREFIDDGRSALDASRAYDAAAEGAPDV